MSFAIGFLPKAGLIRLAMRRRYSRMVVGDRLSVESSSQRSNKSETRMSDPEA